MKRLAKITLLLLAVITPTAFLSSCGGGGAKAVKTLQKVVKSDGAKRAVKTIGRSGDDVARHISSKTVICTTCAGMKQVDFVDEYGNYQYTGDCPDCYGTGEVTKYEFK